MFILHRSLSSVFNILSSCTFHFKSHTVGIAYNDASDPLIIPCQHVSPNSCIDFPIFFKKDPIYLLFYTLLTTVGKLDEGAA